MYTQFFWRLHVNILVLTTPLVCRQAYQHVTSICKIGTKKQARMRTTKDLYSLYVVANLIVLLCHLLSIAAVAVVILMWRPTVEQATSEREAPKFS